MTEASSGIMTSIGGTVSTWIGAKRSPGPQTPNPGTWEWSDGTSWSFTNWASGEPSHVEEECACQRNTGEGTWNDQPCFALKAFICQKTPGKKKHKMAIF